MTPRFNPLDYPSCLAAPSWDRASPWAEHVPFAFALIEMLRPRIVVGVGDATGVSYCALCQAIDRLGLPCRAYGWVGGSDDFDELKAHHDAHHGRFSSLIVNDFEDALAHFTDGSVDLLHIDGQSDDFGAWLPKLSDRGVLLLHGVNDRERDAGAWKFWADLRLRRPTFEFTHGRGLGVAAVGPRCPAALGALLAADEEDSAHVREFYYQLGRRVSQGGEHLRLRGDHRRLMGRLAETEQLLQVYRLQCEERDEMLRRARSELEPIQRSLVLRCVKLLARVEWVLAPAGSRRRDALHLARRGVGALRRRKEAATHEPSGR